MKLFKYLGLAVAFLIGINTEYFARRGLTGIIVYIALFAVAVGIALINPKKHEE